MKQLLQIFYQQFHSLETIFVNQKIINIYEHTIQMVIFTVCSHTFILLRLTKTSVRVETYQLNFRVIFSLFVPFIRRPLAFFDNSFSFLFLFLCQKSNLNEHPINTRTSGQLDELPSCCWFSRSKLLLKTFNLQSY